MTRPSLPLHSPMVARQAQSYRQSWRRAGNRSPSMVQLTAWVRTTRMTMTYGQRVHFKHCQKRPFTSSDSFQTLNFARFSVSPLIL
ncbi:hypothetical protein BDR03DRAFT_482403 [Suillus americanus]|nr:hypothetical protein BDR03DRAFT_482403 [Suillus americanus]